MEEDLYGAKWGEAIQWLKAVAVLADRQLSGIPVSSYLKSILIPRGPLHSYGAHIYTLTHIHIK